MSTEREKVNRSTVSRKVSAAANEWLQPLEFKSVGRASECVFEQWQGDRRVVICPRVTRHGLAVGISPFGRLGFRSAERIFSHFVPGPLMSHDDGRGAAYGLDIDYVQLTRDAYKAHIVWTYADEEEQVLAELHDVVMNFIYATMEPIKTPDDLIDLQVGMLDSNEMFAVGRTLGVDDALRLLTLIRLYRPALYREVRPRLQKALESWGPVDATTTRHLSYLEEADPLPPLPDRSAWAASPTT